MWAHKLIVEEQRYEQIKRYRQLLNAGLHASYLDALISDWYTGLDFIDQAMYNRFLAGDDSAIVVKTEPSPTIKDSLESINDKLDIISGVVRNLEKEVIPDNDLEFIIKFVMFNDSTREVTTKYVSRIVSGKVSLSHWAHEALIFSDKDDAVTLIEDLNESLGRVGLLKNSHFQLDYLV